MDTETGEQWRMLVDFAKYEVSNLGRFRNAATGHILKKRKRPSNGYYFINLSLGHRKILSRNTGPLVAAAWIGPRPPGPQGQLLQVDHINLDKSDERVSNLEYVTQEENVKRSFASGTRQLPDGPVTYMTKADYDEVFALSQSGISQVRIARIMNCSNSAISRILAGKTQPRQTSCSDGATRNGHLKLIELTRRILIENPELEIDSIGVALDVTTEIAAGLVKEAALPFNHNKAVQARLPAAREIFKSEPTIGKLLLSRRLATSQFIAQDILRILRDELHSSESPDLFGVSRREARLARAREIFTAQPGISIREMGKRLGTSKATASAIMVGLRGWIGMVSKHLGTARAIYAADPTISISGLARRLGTSRNPARNLLLKIKSESPIKE